MKVVFFKAYKIYVYTVFALTVLLFYPLTTILILNNKTKKWSTAVFTLWSYVLSILFFIFVKKNKVNLPKEPAIIIANHTSHLDIFLMYQVVPMRHIVFMGKSEILKYPFVSTYFKHLHIPVNRSDKRQAAQSMLTAKKKLAEGWSIIIFPEGGIPDFMAPKVCEFKPGAFVLAKRTNTPIIPVTLINNYALLSEPMLKNGSAHPGIAQIYIHNVIDNKTIQEQDEAETMSKAHDLISSKMKYMKQ